jgi:hypothetical protein
MGSIETDTFFLLLLQGYLLCFAGIATTWVVLTSLVKAWQRHNVKQHPSRR